MGNNFVLRVAFRYFSAKKNNRLVSFISAFSLLGIMIGVAALIIVMSVMEGFHVELTSNIVGLGGDITVESRDYDIENYDEITSKILKLDFVKNALPQINSKGLALSNKDSAGVIIRAFDSKALFSKKQIKDNIYFGDLNDIDKGYNAAMGFQLASSLGIRVGDQFTLISPNTISTIMGNLPRMKKFNLSAIFESGMHDYDSATIIMSLDSAQKLFSYENSVNLIEVHTIDPDRVKNFAEKINYAINYEDSKDNGDLSSDIPWVKTYEGKIYTGKFRVNTWLDFNEQFLNALKVERVAMYTILSLIILVAVFNIVSSLFMLVNEKGRDIAILRTMGASSKQIMMIFVLNGTFVGLIGTFLGIIIGISFAKNIDSIKNFLEYFTGVNLFDSAIYFLSHLPSITRPKDVMFISIMAITFSIIAALYPSYKASKLDPAEALRNE